MNSNPAKELLEKLLNLVSRHNASDLHLLPGFPPTIRTNKGLQPLTNQNLTPIMTQKIAKILLTESEYQQFKQYGDIDFSLSWQDSLRLRVNVYHTNSNIALAMRIIPNRIRSLEELNLPPILGDIALRKEQGLILVVGPTGHGKSTTIASMINLINNTHKKHIITIEDPVEYVFPKGLCLISQREVGKDVLDLHRSLRYLLREDPDVVFIGEMRDATTIELAITIAETGHLVFSTLHTYSASQTIERIVQAFPEDKQSVVRTQLAYILEAVVSQRLVPTNDGGIMPALEILLNNQAVRNLIREGKFFQIDNVIKTSRSDGMYPLEYSLAQLIKEGRISPEIAERYAVYPDEIKYWLTN